MLLKHWVSVRDLCRQENPPVPLINEKLGDAINYLILLEAVLKEGPCSPPAATTK